MSPNLPKLPGLSEPTLFVCMPRIDQEPFETIGANLQMLSEAGYRKHVMAFLAGMTAIILRGEKNPTERERLMSQYDELLLELFHRVQKYTPTDPSD